MQTPRSYSGKSLQARISGQLWLYIFKIGSHPSLALWQTDLHGLTGSWRNSKVQMGAYIAQRKKRSNGLQLVSTNSTYCSIARIAFSWVLWWRWLGILVIFQGIASHIGILIGSQSAPCTKTRATSQKHIAQIIGNILQGAIKLTAPTQYIYSFTLIFFLNMFR